MLRFLYKTILRPILFRVDPERVHDSFTCLGRFLGAHSATRALTRAIFYYGHPTLEQNILGIKFPNPVGLSAGFDKDANLIGIAGEVGFGFIEVGTITAKPYGGNTKPRLRRLTRSKALVVNYGLKNIGAEAVLRKIAQSRSPIIKGISIGKTNSPDTTDTDAGVADYTDCFEQAARSNVGDFYVINISCPNTFGGEPFTTPEKLDKLLRNLCSAGLRTQTGLAKPIFLKMPINLPWEDFAKLLDVAVQSGVDGVVIGNLNKDYSDTAIKDVIPVGTKGGVSGLPTQKLSNELISKTYAEYGKKLVIIGVGGIFSAEDAYEKIKLGASLVELITGMIYEGPQLIGDINMGLARLLARDGYKNVVEAVGAYHKILKTNV